jgi:transcriptional regulator GlxA family with amidase domain
MMNQSTLGTRFCARACAHAAPSVGITSAGVSAGIDMALHLTERLTDEKTARLVQLAIEYDPHPPHGGIDWRNVDRDMFAPFVAQRVKEALADKPELLATLTG